MFNIYKKTGCLLLTFFLLNAFLTITVQGSTGVHVEYHTPEQIRKYIYSSDSTLLDVTEYASEPSTFPPYAEGSLSSATRKNALEWLNTVRYIAGLSHDVVSDSALEKSAMAAAMICEATGTLTHTPIKPPGMSDQLYQLAYNGASSSNLGMGYRNLASSIMYGWMADDDEDNIIHVGHRRWVLNPPMKKTGFGHVGFMSAMYAFDTSGTGRETGVVWPAQTMPVHYFFSSYPWSISLGRHLGNSVKVTLTRRYDNKTWHFYKGTTDGFFSVDNNGYGQEGCIIFRPNGVGEYCIGDIFDVDVSGVGEPVSYSVSFFSLDEIKNLTFLKGSYSLGLGETALTYLSSNAGDTIIDNCRIEYTSSDESVARVDNKGRITGIGYGEAVITAKCDGATASCKVYIAKSIEQASVAFDEDLQYTGDKLMPSFEVRCDGAILLEGIDYEISSWGDNINVTSERNKSYVIIKGKGLYTGTKKAFFNILPAEIEEAELTVKKNFVYTGAAIRPAIIVDFDGSVLTAGEDFNTKFSNNINVGTATVVVQGIGNFTGEKKGSFTILPKGTALKSLKAGSKKITATWSKQAVTGYQIEYSTDKKMLSGTKRKTISSGKTTSLTISGLKAGTRYYVRIRTYKKISGKTYYSAWSKVRYLSR